MMRNIKLQKLFIIAGVVIFIGALVLFRSMDQGHFRNNLSKWAKSSINKNNLVTLANLDKMNKPLLLVIGNAQNIPSTIQEETFRIEANNIINKETLKKLRDYEGSIVLVSKNQDIAAKTWMILSQMGLSNLYLLDEENNETFRYEFNTSTSSEM